MRNSFVHETDCIVRLALEARQNDGKLLKFFDQDMRKGEALPVAEALKITRFGRISYDDWENIYHDFLWAEICRTEHLGYEETPYIEYPHTAEGFINPFIFEQS